MSPAATRSAPSPAPRSLARARRTLRSLKLSSLLVAGLLLPGSAARADATVVVELRRADGSSAEGVVILSRGTAKLQCRTQNGRCEIKAVPGGSYTVEVESAGKPAGKPKTVMIPPSGEVKLIVAAG